MNTTATSQIYEPPGPRARRRHRILAVLFACCMAAVAAWIFTRLASHGQLAADKWSPLIRPGVWTHLLLPGLWGTVKLAVVAGALALAAGLLLGIGRLAGNAPTRWACSTLIEFGRSVPLLLLIIFAQVGSFALIGRAILPFTAVVFGLVIYNGAVLAEVVRAGVRAVPHGQEEAALALGLKPARVMQKVLLPQALRAMMPAILMQLVTLLKDTALAFIVSYPELLRSSQLVGNQFTNVVPAALVAAAIYILLNVLLTTLAHRIERRRHAIGQEVVAARAQP